MSEFCRLGEATLKLFPPKCLFVLDPPHFLLVLVAAVLVVEVVLVFFVAGPVGVFLEVVPEAVLLMRDEFLVLVWRWDVLLACGLLPVG